MASLWVSLCDSRAMPAGHRVQGNANATHYYTTAIVIKMATSGALCLVVERLPGIKPIEEGWGGAGRGR